MGREVRRVPADWVHPNDDRGRYIPLYDEDFGSAARYWTAQFMAWERCDWEWFRIDHRRRWPNLPDFAPDADDFAKLAFWEWHGDPPDRDSHRPYWPEETRTHYQMYEITTEGTPISPVMPSVESLARWLADNGASAFAGMTATYEEWLAMCQQGWTISGVVVDGEVLSGVKAAAGL